MKNYLVITLGTREVQIPLSKIEKSDFEILEEKGEKFSKFFIQSLKNSSIKIEVRQPSKEFPDFFTISPRTTGKVISENFELFQPIIDFPIVKPALEYLRDMGIKLDVIMLVHTDQSEAFEEGRVKFQNQENDSLYFSDIISKLIGEDSFFDGCEIDQFVVRENVTDLGYQYDDFKRINSYLLYSNEVNQVFLYPQGGIDQINQALVLRLIETFKGNVKQLQKAEGADFKELDFPSKFLQSLNKQIITKHLADYDFGLTIDFFNGEVNKTNRHLAFYADRRINMQHNQLVGHISYLKDKTDLNLDFDIKNNLERIKDLYLSAKIYLHQKKYGDFISKIYTLGENILKRKIESFYNVEFELCTGDNYIIERKFKQILNTIGTNSESFLNNFIVKNNKTAYTNKPSRWGYYAIYKFGEEEKDFVINPLYDKLFYKIDELAEKRNELLHNMKPVDSSSINNVLGLDYKIDGLMSDFEAVLGISNFGIYDDIKAEIENLL